MLRSRIVLTFALLSASCGGQPLPEELGEQSSAIVYGDDNRLDVFEHPDAALRDLTRSSVVALIRRDILRQTQTGSVTLGDYTLADSYKLCAGERFENQQIAADCSGVLIDDDIVVTAAHCFDMIPCEQYVFAFDYYYSAPRTLEEMSSADLFYCRHVIAKQESLEGEAKVIDFAVIQLDRPVTAPRKPASIRLTSIAAGEPVIAIGFPSGLPAKIDTGARVLDTRPAEHDFFAFDTDTFKGSSGSGIFDASGALLGVLVRGGEDYKPMGTCNITNKVSVDDVDEWEEATYVEYAVKGLCDSGFPSEALCKVEPSCGDGYCTDGEYEGTCPKDCLSKACLEPPCAKDLSSQLALGEPKDEDRAKSMTDLGSQGGCTAHGNSHARSRVDLALFALALAFVRRRGRAKH